MKKSLIALAMVAAFGAAFATQPGPAIPSSVAGVSTSSVAGAVGSNSSVGGVNSVSFHGAFATSTNTTAVGGIAQPGTSGASVGTGAVTHGHTVTGAFGSGPGAAEAVAGQAGYGKVTSQANVAGVNTTGQVNAVSEVGTNTWSSAKVVDTGVALSTSKGGAFNLSTATVSAANNGSSAVTTNAVGSTVGADGVRTSGIAFGGGSVDAGATSAQAGSYSGTVTRTFTNGSVVNNPPGNGGGNNGGGSGCTGGPGNCGNGNGGGGGNGTGDEGGGNDDKGGGKGKGKK